MYVERVHFHHEFVDTNKVEAHGTQHTKETIKLNLGLRVAGLVLIPSNGAEARGAVSTIGAVLRKDPSDTSDRRVNC